MVTRETMTDVTTLETLPAMAPTQVAQLKTLAFVSAQLAIPNVTRVVLATVFMT